MLSLALFLPVSLASTWCSGFAEVSGLQSELDTEDRMKFRTIWRDTVLTVDKVEKPDPDNLNRDLYLDDHRCRHIAWLWSILQ